MEILAEILFTLVGGIVEFVFGIIFQILAELFAETFGKPRAGKSAPNFPRTRLLISLAVYSIGGALAGCLSLWLYPSLFLTTPWQKWANIILMPMITGALFQIIDNWRETPDTPPPPLAGFWRGFLFAVMMTGVRFLWGK